MSETHYASDSSTAVVLKLRARELAASLQDELLGAMIVTTADGQVVYWNAAACVLYGYTPDEAVDRALIDLTVIPADQTRTEQWLHALPIQGHSALKTERRRRDGSRVMVEVIGKAVPSSDGVEVLLVLNERESSTFQRAAGGTSSNAWTDDHFRDLLEAAPDAMVIVDRTGCITLVNSQTEALFGYRREELLGLSVDVLVPVPVRDVHAAHRAKYFIDPHRRPMGIGLSLSGRRKDGSEFPVEISLSPVHTDEGPLVTAAVRDISARINVEKQLTAANAELEAFTYSVSHDLRAPIRQIDGFASILTEHLGAVADDRTRHYLQRIREGSKNMGRLVDDLLNLSRVGRSDVHPRVVALGAIVREVMNDLQSEYVSREVVWRIDALPTVEYDLGLIKVVFTNLIANALKYTRPRAEAVIEIGCSSHKLGHVIHVRDNGVGFDMKYADQLFGVFQRLHHTDEFEGAGVGLATVLRIVRKHGGEVWAEAEPNRGATFYFTVGPAIPATPASA
ncbi:MAG: PAS domain S-box protein [Gemmatimonadota bacterium]